MHFSSGNDFNRVLPIDSNRRSLLKCPVAFSNALLTVDRAVRTDNFKIIDFESTWHLTDKLIKASEGKPKRAKDALQQGRRANVHRTSSSTYELVEPDSTQCPCGCGEMVRIGEDRTERLDIVPARLRVVVTIRPKYACRRCEEGVTQAPALLVFLHDGRVEMDTNFVENRITGQRTAARPSPSARERITVLRSCRPRLTVRIIGTGDPR